MWRVYVGEEGQGKNGKNKWMSIWGNVGFKVFIKDGHVWKKEWL